MTFREHAAVQIADAENTPRDKYRGADWWQLEDEEASVFAIDPARFPRMSAALTMFEIFTGQMEPEALDIEPEALAAERAARPDLVKRDATLDGFQHFAKDYFGLTFREAHAVYAKTQFWRIRQGITGYRDETPPRE